MTAHDSPVAALDPHLGAQTVGAFERDELEEEALGEIVEECCLELGTTTRFELTGVCYLRPEKPDSRDRHTAWFWSRSLARATSGPVSTMITDRVPARPGVPARSAD